MRLLSHIFVLAFIFAFNSLSADIFLNRGAETSEWTVTSGEESSTVITFNFSGLEVKLPRTIHWVENPMMLRPQLLLLRCGPVKSPSSVHLELLANHPKEKDEGLLVQPTDPSEAIGPYKNDSKQWSDLADSPLLTSLHSTGYQRLENTFPPDQRGFREEIYIFTMNGLGFRLRLLFSPELDAKDKASIYASLSKLTIQYPPAKK